MSDDTLVPVLSYRKIAAILKINRKRVARIDRSAVQKLKARLAHLDEDKEVK